MMKFASKFLLVGAIAAVAIAVSVAPSDAAKRKKATAKSCTTGATCSTACSGGTCNVKVCGGDGAWYTAILTPWCPTGNCPKKC